MEAMLYPGESAPTADTDADGIADWMETALVGTSPRFTRVAVGDLDGDGMPDLWEHQYGRWKYPTLGLSVRHHDAAADADHDLLTNLQEHQYQSHPLINDTDGNGTLDGYEDADGDGVHLVGELLLGTDPFNPDSDGDGISDGDEDSDGDGISNPAEINLGTDPLAKDSDGDGWDDDEELALGGDPDDPNDQPVLEPSSSYVTIQTRWVGANWHEQGGDYYSMHWNYIWTSTDPPVGDWQFSESHSSNPREEQGEAQFSDGETRPVSSLGEAQGALSNLSQVSEWEDLGGGNMIVGSSFGEVPGRPQPDPPQWFPEYPNGTSSHGWEGSTQDTRAWNGGAMEVRLTWKPNAPKPHRRQDVTFNLVKTKTITGQDPTYTVYPLQLLANQEYSTSGGTAGGVIALAANATTPDTSVAESLGQVGQVLQPKLAENTTPTGNSALEIEKDSDGKEILEHVTHVRLCRWLGAYYGQDIADRAKFPKDDHDRFVIRLPLPDKAGAGMISVQLSTEDAAGIQTDDPTEIELTETGANSGVFESPALALAADEDDDKLTKDENAKNDPTHLGKAGGKIVVKIPALQNAQMKFDIQAATHKLKVTFVAITPPTAGSFTVKLWSTPPVPVAVSLTPQQCLDEIAKQKKRCIEIYAQLGIQVEATDRGSLSAYGSDAAAWSRIDDAIRKGNVESGPALDAIPLEERGFDLLGRMGDIKQLASSLKEEDNIVVVLIPAAFADIPGNSENEQGAAGLYVNAHEGWCFVSIPWIVQAAYKSATATHEIGHGLGLTHDTRMACELMCSGANPNAHGIANPSNPYRDQKRFVWPDIKKLLKERISNPLAKKFLIPVTP
jgi:hypothetical protein